MKILLAPLGSHGDVHPFIGLGIELARRGHRVVVLTNAHFRELAERAGLPFVEVSSAEEFRQAIDNPDIWHPTKGVRLMMEWAVIPMRAMYERIVELHEPGETVVVNSPIGLGARMAQEKLGLPLATVHISPLSLRSVCDPALLPGIGIPSWSPLWMRRLIYWAGDVLIDRWAVAPLNEFRAELGLAPVKRFAGGWWYSPHLNLGLFPDWFAPPPPDWPPGTRLAGFPLFDERTLSESPPDLEDFLKAGEPPLVFTPGSAMVHGKQFFDAALDATRLLNRRCVLLTSFAENLPPSMPEWARHFRYVPFSRIFPRAAAVVHHGGIGTTAQGLAAAVPQLFMPMGFDQVDNAARVCRLGCGAVLKPKKFKGPMIAELLRSISTPEVKKACMATAERFAGADPVGRACDWIEDLPRLAGKSLMPALG